MGLNKMGFDPKVFDADEGSTLDPPIKRTGIKAVSKRRSPYNNMRRTTQIFGQKESKSNLDNRSVINELDDQSEILD